MAAKEPVPKCARLFLVAVSSEEAALRDVSREMELTWTKREDPTLGPYFRIDRGNEPFAIVVRTAMGVAGLRSSAILSWRFQIALEATTILQIGMAFGVAPRAQTFGDVLVAECLLPYDQRILNASGVSYERVEEMRVDPALLRRFNEYKKTFTGSSGITVRMGAMLSGGSVINSAKARDDLVEALRSRTTKPIIGGEMEALGIVGVGLQAPAQWGVIKGISDFADETRNEHLPQTRPIACTNAARFALGAMLYEPPKEPS